MAVAVSAVDKFVAVKTKRDTLSRQVAMLEGKLSSSRERYNEIMRELARYNIGSVDELKAKITDLDGQINTGLGEAESLLSEIEVALVQLDKK